MVPTSYRLDTLAVLLIARLEPTRRAHEDEDGALEAYRGIVEDAARGVANECRDTYGDLDQAARVEREAVATFLPRYARLAAKQNAEEARGYGFAFGDGPLARVGATLFAFAGAALVSRVIHHWVDVLFFVAACAVPLIPEIRVAWSRRRYAAALQELADDLGRLQDAEQDLAPAPRLPIDEPVTPRPRAPQKETP